METLIINTQSLKLSEDDFFNFCVQNSELQIERDQNQNIILMAPTGSETGNKNSEINAQIVIWNKQHKLGYVFDSNSGFTLQNMAVRSPDAAFILKSKWEGLPLDDREKFAHICPDFVIELLSKTDNLKTTQLKMEEWITNGCRLAWLIDPKEQTVYIYKPNTRCTELHGFDKNISGEDVLPGFELELKELL